MDSPRPTPHSLHVLPLCKLSGVKLCTLFGVLFEYGPTLARLTEEARKLALDRVRQLHPHLEDDRPLKAVASAAGIPFRTAQRWVSTSVPRPFSYMFPNWMSASSSRFSAAREYPPKASRVLFRRPLPSKYKPPRLNCAVASPDCAARRNQLAAFGQSVFVALHR